MNVMKKISLALSTVAILASSSFCVQLLTGGNIPLVNNIVGLGVISLDFSSPGADVTLASFIVNNNSRLFVVDWTLTHAGNFTSATGATIPMLDIKLNPNGQGTLGAPLGAPDVPIANLAIVGAATSTWTYNQTAATVNYGLVLTADWADPSSKLAGLYTEQVVFKITATL
jgi:hypothetical protein